MARRTGPRERGAAAVEMAIILPLLLLVIGGIVDFGRFFFSQVTFANAAREGARAAVVGADGEARAWASFGPSHPSGVSISVGPCGTGVTQVTATVTDPNFKWIILDPAMHFFGGNIALKPSSQAVMACGG